MLPHSADLSGRAGRSSVPPLSEQSASAIGIILLFILIAAAVVDFILIGIRLSRYDYLEKEPIDLEYGVYGVVQEKDEQFSTRYAIGIAVGVMLCIVGVIPLVAAGIMEAPDHILSSLVCLLLALIALAVFLFIRVGMIKESYQKLMQSGEYTRSKKKHAQKMETIGGVYWTVVTAIYLLISFRTFRWHETWIIWPVAGVLYATLSLIVMCVKKKK